MDDLLDRATAVICAWAPLMDMGEARELARGILEATIPVGADVA
jgi:hypothetical protein